MPQSQIAFSIFVQIALGIDITGLFSLGLSLPFCCFWQVFLTLVSEKWVNDTQERNALFS